MGRDSSRKKLNHKRISAGSSVSTASYADSNMAPDERIESNHTDDVNNSFNMKILKAKAASKNGFDRQNINVQSAYSRIPILCKGFLQNVFKKLIILVLLFLLFKQAQTYIFSWSESSQTKGDMLNLRIAIIECPGGTDKDPLTGHRKDSKFLLAGLLSLNEHVGNKVNVEAEIVSYTDYSSDSVFSYMSLGTYNKKKFDAYISRVDPGEYDLCSEEKYFLFLDNLISKANILPFNSPKDMLNLGSKKSLLNLAGMHYFPNSTYVYSNLKQFDLFFPKTLRHHKSRVIKQNRGSKGEGVWWVKMIEGSPSTNSSAVDSNNASTAKNARLLFTKDSLVSKFLSTVSSSTNFVSSFPSFSSFKGFQDADALNDKAKSPVPQFYSPLLPEFTLYDRDTSSNISDCSSHEKDALINESERQLHEMEKIKIKLVEAKDNHQEFSTLRDFRDKVIKHYIDDSDDEFVVDMEYLPRISEGEVRLILSGRKVLFVVNKQPQKQVVNSTKENDGGEAFSANLGAGAKHDWETPEKWAFLVDPFIGTLDEMLERMHVDQPPILWTVDFIRYGELQLSSEKNETVDADKEQKSHFVISEINASCVGFSAHPGMGKVIAQILLDTVKGLLNRS